MSRVFISIFAALVLLAGCSDEEDILPTQKTKIVSYLTGTHSPKLVAYEELEEESLPGHSALGFDLLLNATSVGMYPNTGESPVSGAVLSRCAAVFDAVYNPAQTELLRLAGQAGAKTIGGMEMLVYQAVAAHEIWYGSRFRQEDIALLCQDAQEELSRIFPGKETEKGRGAQ